MNSYQTLASHSVVPETVTNLYLDAAAISERGRARKENEDTILHYVGQTLTGETFGLFMVSDGMGGYQAGKFASQTAVRVVALELAPILPRLSELPLSTLERHLRRAIVAANHQLWQHMQTNAEASFRMGATMTLALLARSRLHLAHVGDSRVYLWRKGVLHQLTQDHSLVAELAQHVPMTPEQMETHPYRSVVTRSLGSRETIEIDYLTHELQPGDRVLLCSDGLWMAFSDQTELSQWLALSASPAEQCQRLVAAANRHDASDDMSLIICHCHTALDHHLSNSDATSFPHNNILAS